MLPPPLKNPTLMITRRDLIFIHDTRGFRVSCHASCILILENNTQKILNTNFLHNNKGDKQLYTN